MYVNHFQVVELLIEHGAQLEVRTDTNCSPLHLACLFGRYDVVQCLHQKGAQLEVLDFYNNTPLHLACQAGNWKMCHISQMNIMHLRQMDKKGRKYKQVVKYLMNHKVQMEAEAEFRFRIL